MYAARWLSDAVDETETRLTSIEPTTIAGAAALARYTIEFEEQNGTSFTERYFWEAFQQTIRMVAVPKKTQPWTIISANRISRHFSLVSQHRRCPVPI
jgi:hypothetical protein